MPIRVLAVAGLVNLDLQLASQQAGVLFEMPNLPMTLTVYAEFVFRSQGGTDRTRCRVTDQTLLQRRRQDGAFASCTLSVVAMRRYRPY